MNKSKKTVKINPKPQFTNMRLFGIGGKKKETASAKKQARLLKKTSNVGKPKTAEKWFYVFKGDEYKRNLTHVADIKATSGESAIRKAPANSKRSGERFFAVPIIIEG